VAAPPGGGRTPYAVLFGDALAWLSLGGLPAVALIVVLRRRSGAARPASPDPAAVAVPERVTA
jgi:hypothetical protein